MRHIHFEGFLVVSSGPDVQPGASLAGNDSSDASSTTSRVSGPAVSSAALFCFDLTGPSDAFVSIKLSSFAVAQKNATVRLPPSKLTLSLIIL